MANYTHPTKTVRLFYSKKEANEDNVRENFNRFYSFVNFLNFDKKRMKNSYSSEERRFFEFSVKKGHIIFCRVSGDWHLRKKIFWINLLCLNWKPIIHLTISNFCEKIPIDFNLSAFVSFPYSAAGIFRHHQLFQRWNHWLRINFIWH